MGICPSPIRIRNMQTLKLKKDKLEGRPLLYSRRLPAMTCDTNYPELDHTSRVKGTVFLHKTALASDTSCQFGVPRSTLPSDQLAINSGVPMSPFRFNNSLQWFTELRKVLNSRLQFYDSKRVPSEPDKERTYRSSGRVPNTKLPTILSLWSPGVLAALKGTKEGQSVLLGLAVPKSIQNNQYAKLTYCGAACPEPHQSFFSALKSESLLHIGNFCYEKRFEKYNPFLYTCIEQLQKTPFTMVTKL